MLVVIVCVVAILADICVVCWSGVDSLFVFGRGKWV